MKGKIAFVLGAAVGYVLGARAGRARYEQIKRGAEKVWHADPVQKGVGLVRDAVDDRADEVMAFVRRASADAFSSYANRAEQKSREKRAEKTAERSADKSAEAKKDQARKKAPKATKAATEADAEIANEGDS